MADGPRRPLPSLMNRSAAPLSLQEVSARSFGRPGLVTERRGPGADPFLAALQATAAVRDGIRR